MELGPFTESACNQGRRLPRRENRSPEIDLAVRYVDRSVQYDPWLTAGTVERYHGVPQARVLKAFHQLGLIVPMYGYSASFEVLFEFRNAATVTVVHELLRENDRLQEQAAAPVASHSLGTLTAAEAALLSAYRKANEDSKRMIQIAADVSVQVDEEFAARDRCEVVDIASVRVIKE